MTDFGQMIDVGYWQLAADGLRPFRHDAVLERIDAMRRTRPRDYASLAPPVKIALANYQAAKRRAEQMKGDGQQ